MKHRSFESNRSRSSFARPSMMLLALVAAALLLPACSPDDPFVPTRKTTSGRTYTGSGAFLRVIHASSDAPAVRVLVDTSRFFETAQSYLGFSSDDNDAKYYPVDNAAGKISFLASGINVTATLALAKDQFYTAYLYGEKGDYHALVTADSLTPTPSGSQARYRIVHLSPKSSTLDIHQDQENATPVITGLQYGSASGYVTSKAYYPGAGTGLWASDKNGKTVAGAPAPYVIMPGGKVFTIVMTGTSQPTGSEPFILFSAFLDNNNNSGETFFGNTPIRLQFGAIRFVNLIPYPAGVPDANLDVAFLDSSDSPWAVNQYFRLTFQGQQAVRAVHHIDSEKVNTYSFLQPTFLRTWCPYRIEEATSKPFYDPAFRPSLTEKQPFVITAGRRYTIVGYGPHDSTQARSTVVVDDVPPVGSTGIARVRFFHGAFGALEGKRLRLRVGATTGFAMAYGAAPGKETAIDLPAGMSDVSVIDETNTVLYTQPMTLDGGIHTIFFSRGAAGDTFSLRSRSDQFSIQ